MSRINARLAAEMGRTVIEVLPRCDDWTSVHVASTNLLITAIALGSIFVASDFCRREEYVDSSINFTVDIFTATPKLKKWSPGLRPIEQYFILELKRVAEHRRNVKELLDPVITER
ncbi:uncharacterized protein F4817DRAFT_108786 [Daldinia loculata]|uniref:uncharacterized protein n=1 Tax=Daldinia loculata TaxID=103429 RepID=UPI0020C1DEFB|nr:uncharacterized protein F4817DRAFT_108786 [Daldinia loculata]KAI1647155.1 hypothetical protein F4817DRAFT_108786 [Daldinia loculata]